MTSTPAPDSDAPEPHRDAAAFQRLIESLEVPVILVLISSWMGDRLKQELTPEDIWQETLAMAWRDRASHRWCGRQAFRAWLLGIARNRVRDAADHMNTQKRGQGRHIQRFSTLVGSEHPSVSGLLPPGSTTPSRVAANREQAQAMEESLAVLPHELREVVRLRFFEELPMREVGERLGIPRTTANDRLLQGVSRFPGRAGETSGA